MKKSRFRKASGWSIPYLTTLISDDYRQGMPMAGVLEVHIPTTEIRSPRSRTLAPIPWRGL